MLTESRAALSVSEGVGEHPQDPVHAWPSKQQHGVLPDPPPANTPPLRYGVKATSASGGNHLT